MNTKLLITIPIILSSTLLGTPDQNGDSKPPSFPIRDEIVKRFDTDGDGRLNDEERTTIRKAFENRKAEAFESSDADGQEIRDQVETEPNRSSDL